LLETCKDSSKHIVEEIVKMEHLDLHTGWPLIHSNYTRCINTIVLLRMSTELLETCRGFK